MFFVQAVQLPTHLLPQDPAIIWYNRIPRCGSRLLKELIKKMAEVNHFAYSNGPPQFSSIPAEEQFDLCRNAVNHFGLDNE